MTCQDMMELMQRSLDLDLSAAEEQAMLAHLQGCPGCADLYDRLKLLTGELAQLPKVVPPYSIVDSILPQLEGLGGLAEPGAAVDTQTARHTDELAARRERKGLISWKIVAGVTAAGIMLGMYLFNGGPGSLDQKTAEEAAQPKQMQNSAAATGAGEPKMGSLPEAIVVMDVAADKAAPASTPQAIAAAEPSMQAVAKGAAASASPQPGAASKQPVSAASRGEQGMLKAMDQYGDNAAASSSPRTIETKGAVEDSSALRAVTEANSNSPAAKAADPTPKTETSGSAAKEESAISSLSGPELAPAPDGSLADSNKLFGFTTSAKSTAPTIQTVTSGDGAYTAQLTELSVAITGKDGQELFRSGMKLVAGDVLTFKGWSEGGLFTYSIKKPDGKETVYRISVQERKETVQ